ncbi:MAG TPA: metal ABC transporter permease [Mycobacteriales bacterium]
MLTRLLVEPFDLPFMQRALVEALLLGVVAGVVSVFVLLRRLAFVSDALTHTVFPGVVIGYLVAATDGVVWGALAFALLSAVLFTVLSSGRRVTEDATLAMLLTGFFSLGVVLVSRRSSYTADLTTFLFGRILFVDSREIVETAVIGAVVLAVLLLVGKELVLRAFDPGAAAALGYRVAVLDLVLNVAVALVVVAAVKAVGTVLVIALLTVPGATARLLSARLPVVMALSVAVACLSGWVGLAVSYEASVDHGVRLASGGTVVLAMVACYTLALPAGAVAARWGRRRVVPAPDPYPRRTGVDEVSG